jgi:hypothetical protein
MKQGTLPPVCSAVHVYANTRRSISCMPAPMSPRRASRRLRLEGGGWILRWADVCIRKHLLYGGADVAEADVDAGLADARVGGVAHRLGQGVVPRVEVVREGAVDDPPYIYIYVYTYIYIYIYIYVYICIYIHSILLR